MTTRDEPETCGCWDESARDVERSNPPGRSSIDYRLGTHGRLLEGMLRRLPSQEANGPKATTFPLAHLLTEATEDPAIALVDAWAVVEDILTFYQERLANEGFLRTAVERRSLQELAEMIGYQPAPGVAASVGLAFEVEDAQGAPGRATVPAGTRVLSLPDGDSLPQAFETSEAVEVRAEWNAMRPRMSKPIDPYASVLWFEGTNTQLAPADWVIVESEGVAPCLMRVEGVTALQDDRRTRVVLAKPTTYASEGSDTTASETTDVEPPGAQTFKPPLNLYSVRDPAAPNTADARPTPTSEDSTGDTKKTKTSPAWIQWINNQHGLDPVEADTYLAALTDAPVRVKVLREHVAFFGHNAPAQTVLSAALGAVYLEPWENNSIWSTGRNSEHDDDSDTFYLEREVRSLALGQYIVVSSSNPDVVALGDSNGEVQQYATAPVLYEAKSVCCMPRTDYAMTAKTSRVVVQRIATLGSDGPHVNAPRFYFREAMASVGEKTLELVGEKDSTPLAKGASAIDLDGYVPSLYKGQRIILSGELQDLEGVIGVEEHLLDDVDYDLNVGKAWTTIRLASQLANSYVRATVQINGNVVPATHGESHVEIIGSGDASVANQRFRLQRVPLTHVATTGGRGAKSTLEIWVGGVRWTQVDSLFELGPNDRGFVVDIDDDGNTHVVFGDGLNGALLPTGLENVEARYRFGLGLAGQVGAGKIMLLQQRPLGIRSVTNPRPAGDAEDPEPRDRIRCNAPLTVRTFDRVVSASDYEDFARAFAGIGKTAATRLWRGDREIAHLTVTAADGSPASQTLRARLAEAIRSHADPSQRFQIDAHVALSFSLKVAVQVDPTRDANDVLTRVRQRLMQAYAFESRELAQSVSHAEVMVLVQQTHGVVACRVEGLERSGDLPQKALQGGVLGARPARTTEDDGITEIHAAELLLLDPNALQVVEEQP